MKTVDPTNQLQRSLDRWGLVGVIGILLIGLGFTVSPELALNTGTVAGVTGLVFFTLACLMGLRLRRAKRAAAAEIRSEASSSNGGE